MCKTKSVLTDVKKNQKKKRRHIETDREKKKLVKVNIIIIMDYTDRNKCSHIEKIKKKRSFNGSINCISGEKKKCTHT